MTENEKNDRPQAVTNWKAKIRYDATITNQMRMVHDSHTIEITGLTWDKRRIWMHLRGVTEN
jgi:head-tail adaptor